MIQNIILDIGNVLANFRSIEYLKDLGFDENTIHHVATATVKNPIWNEFDRGAKTDEEIIEACILSAPDYKNEITLFFEKIVDIVHEYDYAASWIKEMKSSGYSVYLLSNYPKTAFTYAKKNFSFFEHVDGGVISYEIHKIKPEPGIYTYLLSKYNLDPTTCVFLDDRQDNIEAAYELGFETILFTSYEQAKLELSSLGVTF